MRLLTFDDDGSPQAGVLLGEDVVPVSALDAPARSVKGLLEALDANGLADLGDRATRAQQRIALSNVRLHAPVPDPEKIICLGLNLSLIHI